MSRGSRKQLTVGGLAGAAALAVGNQAYADVLETTFDYSGFTAPIPPDSTSPCFDIDQDGTGDFNISWVNAGAQRVRVNGDARTGDFPCDATNLVIGGYYGATRFLLDDTIDAGASTYSRSFIKYSQPDLSPDSFAAVPQAFAGIVFYSTRDNAEHLAWLEFNFDGDGTRSGGKLVGAGWNDVPVGSPGGQTVTAGRLPEPGAASLQAMALGAVTVLVRRRARRESARTNAS